MNTPEPLNDAVNQRTAPGESELAAYRYENDRLAREITLLRRTLGALLAGGGGEPELDRALLLPCATPTGSDVMFSIDRCRIAAMHLEIAGWAFCPQIDSATATTYLWLLDGSHSWLVFPRKTPRIDVREHFLSLEAAAATRLGIVNPAALIHAGFAVNIPCRSFGASKALRLEIQIDGPNDAARRATGRTLDI